MAIAKKIRIGDLLVEHKLITTDQLNEALQLQKQRGGKIGNILINSGYVKESQLLNLLSKQLKMPHIDIEHYDINKEYVNKVPEKLARRFKVLVVDKDGEDFLVAIGDPTDIDAIDEVSRILDGQVKFAIVSEHSLVQILDKTYRRTQDIASYATELKKELGPTESSQVSDYDQLGGDSAPVAKLIKSIFTDAIQIGASDIHIEPAKDKFLIRQRVDGVLQEHEMPGTEIVNALVLRIKLMSKLDIAEKRVPQDGRFHIVAKGHELDVRVSTMPIKYGESVVMRLLDQTQGIIDLDKIGFSEAILNRVHYLITRPSGLILVTGPTGSGKTTTLYGILNVLNTAGKKIITIEDPIEYSLPRINQVQVNAAIELTFARVLRASLRQDPDIIMIGEMRDEETASIGIRAAMTGHLVLSTLHTNDAISSAMRLVDMGTEGYLVAAALKAVFSQRLIRKICDSCKEKTPLNEEEIEWISALFGDVNKSWEFYKGIGCTACGKTGYAGRMAVHEMLEITSELAEFLKESDGVGFTESAMSQAAFKPLTSTVFELALSGKTSIAEVFRIASEIEEVRKSGKGGARTDLSKISI